MAATSWFALAALLLVSACAAPATRHDGDDLLVLEVAAHRVDCTGEMPQRCLLVREPSTVEWTRFHDDIEGFAYEDGYRYRLRVARMRRPDPPADASAFTYRLVEVLAKERVAPGDTLPG